MTVGIILANTGSPCAPTEEAVRSYLAQFLMDPRIRQAPLPIWWCLLHGIILRKRPAKVAKRYEQIWTQEGAPLIVQQEKLARAVEQELRSRDIDVRVVSAMSYGEPSFHTVLKQLQAEGIEQLILFSMYPQSAFSPTQAVIDAFYRSLERLHYTPQVHIVERFGSHPVYISHLAEAFRAAGFKRDSNDKIFLSFHAIPLKDVEEGDTYCDQIEETACALANELSIDREQIIVGYQSVFGPHPDRWTSPLSIDLLRNMHDCNQDKKNTPRVFFATPIFMVDCLEVLRDVPHHMLATYLYGATFDELQAAYDGMVEHVPCDHALEYSLPESCVCKKQEQIQEALEALHYIQRRAVETTDLIMPTRGGESSLSLSDNTDSVSVKSESPLVSENARFIGIRSFALQPAGIDIVVNIVLETLAQSKGMS